MTTGDRDFRLFIAIMKYLGEKRDPFTRLQTLDLVDLLPPEHRNPDSRKDMRGMYSYVKFLEQLGYVKLGIPTLEANCTVELTSTGEMFVQPELAQLTNPHLMAEMIDAMEKQILTYPEEAEREKYLFRFREAAAKHTPDLLVKLFVEIMDKLIRGG